MDKENLKKLYDELRAGVENEDGTAISKAIDGIMAERQFENEEVILRGANLDGHRLSQWKKGQSLASLKRMLWKFRVICRCDPVVAPKEEDVNGAMIIALLNTSTRPKPEEIDFLIQFRKLRTDVTLSKHSYLALLRDFRHSNSAGDEWD